MHTSTLNQSDKIQKENKGGPLYYIGNRNLTWPKRDGRMVTEKSLLDEHFAVILTNRQSKKFKRCYEPFSGCASWSLAAMELGLAEEYVINDSDEALINTLQLIKDNPGKIKQTYVSLVNAYHHSGSKKKFFLKVIDDYNNSNALEERSLLLPFIINYSWGGILFHDDKKNIVYRDAVAKGITISQGYLDEASISLEDFLAEVDRTSHLLNINKVTFKSGDFLLALSDMQTGDFVALNPPYPETSRARSENSGMYMELYVEEILHNNLVDVIRKMESNNIDYYMTYGCHDLGMMKFVVKDDFNQIRHFFRILGQEDSIFGVGLDQMYFSSKYSIPENLRSKIIPAKDVLQGRELTVIEAMESFTKTAQILENQTFDNNEKKEASPGILDELKVKVPSSPIENTTSGHSLQTKRHIIFLTNIFRIRIDLERLKSENINFYLITTESVLSRTDKTQLTYFTSVFKINFNDKNLENAIRNLIEAKSLEISEIAIVTNDESAIVPAAKLREKFGIDGATVETAELFIDKIKMKEKMAKNGIRIPKFIAFNPTKYLEDKEVYISNLYKYLTTNHIFAKPIDSFGSNDVSNLKTRSDLIEWCETHTTATNFELDEFLEGELFHIDTIVVNQKIVEAQAHKYAYPLAEVIKGKPFAGRLVSPKEDDYRELIQFNEKVLTALQPLPNGVTHLEVYKKQNGELVFLEIACRPSAGFTPEISELHCGVNFEEAHYRVQIGLPIKRLIPLNERVMYAAYLFYPKIEGEVTGLTKELGLKTVSELKYYVKPKENLSPAKHIMDCVATVFMMSQDTDLLEHEFQTAVDLRPVGIYPKISNKDIEHNIPSNTMQFREGEEEKNNTKFQLA